MARYGNFNINKKKKINKPLIAALCVLAAVLLVLFIIGVTVGSDSEDMAHTSSAVRENTELKAQISEMTEEIEALNARIAELETQLAAAPTPAPVVETALPSAGGEQDEPVYSNTEPMSPREGFR